MKTCMGVMKVAANQTKHTLTTTGTARACAFPFAARGGAGPRQFQGAFVVDVVVGVVVVVVVVDVVVTATALAASTAACSRRQRGTTPPPRRC